MNDTLLKQAAGRIDRMATARGLDLQEISLRAGLTPDDLATMVQRCAGCAQPGACETWLDAQAGRAVSATPGYCRNSEVFKGLASG